MIPSSSRSTTPNPRSDSIPRSLDATTNSSIRPRNRRLNTLEDQELSTTSGTSTPRAGSRDVSPIPAKHPSRSGASGNSSNGRLVGGFLAPSSSGRHGGSNGNGSSSPVGGMWNTGWMSSALQQVASSVLGSMAPEDDGPSNRGASPRPKPRRRGGSGGNSKRALPEAWGPSQLTANKIGMGSTSERDTEVRARKMRGVLEGRDEDKRAMDTNGKYKRRISAEEDRPSTAQDEGDALVYIHHVKPTDTFAGVVLKYNCQKEVFRKANGLWSNDGLQFRKTVVLPVNACAIKGRPCEPPSADNQGVDLLAPTPGIEDPHPFTNGNTWPSITSPYGTSAEPPENDGNPWSHVRWVLIDSSPSSEPVEIARMSRKTLGYFPPRRRKSIATQSSVSTPRGSTDLSQISQSISNEPGSSASTPPRRTSNLGPRPSQPLSSIGSYFPPSPMTSSTRIRPRRESVGEAADRLGWMRGPGGVGTMGSNVRKPGPGQDGLNSWAKKHIPGLAIDSLPSTSIMGAESAHFGFSDELAAIAEGPINGASISGTATPSGNGMGLENAAAAVEGFFRKLVIKGPGTPLLRARAESDLIELLDGAGSDDGRGFEISPGRARSATPVGTGREDLDSVIRGRASAGAKGGKSD
ncbi:hypothetical protein G7Y89_g812 [Cudoniella acicularis]|uniref:LysM domain-containing protein n=1 Tax=Cudoniella acicularis TaxID=354080 RepID=A0A8H4RZC0_9HELO|nr:hypothetical protein G7Y89_g812 [Cudoniella acicularis]